MNLASELCQTVGDKLFFTLHIFLEVVKTQDLPSKIWETLGDALTCLIIGTYSGTLYMDTYWLMWNFCSY
jgi:hypothetical protein